VWRGVSNKQQLFCGEEREMNAQKNTGKLERVIPGNNYVRFIVEYFIVIHYMRL